jgi:hypothetical protein
LESRKEIGVGKTLAKALNLRSESVSVTDCYRPKHPQLSTESSGQLGLLELFAATFGRP